MKGSGRLTILRYPECTVLVIRWRKPSEISLRAWICLRKSHKHVSATHGSR